MEDPRLECEASDRNPRWNLHDAAALTTPQFQRQTGVGDVPHGDRRFGNIRRTKRTKRGCSRRSGARAHRPWMTRSASPPSKLGRPPPGGARRAKWCVGGRSGQQQERNGVCSVRRIVVEKLARADPEGIRDLRNDGDCRISDASLDTADVGTVQPALEGKTLLRKSSVLAIPPKVSR